MGEIINLRRARKTRERASKETVAAENRMKSGTPKALRQLKEARSEKEQRDLEAKRLERPAGEDP